MNWRHVAFAGFVLIAAFLFLSTTHAQSFATDDSYASERSYQPPPAYQPKPGEPSPGDRIVDAQAAASAVPAELKGATVDFRDTLRQSSLAPFSEIADDAGDPAAADPS